MGYTRLKFTAADAAEITGVKPATLQNWLKRDIIVGHKSGIEGGTVQGKHRSFDVFAVSQIAMTKALVDLGLATKRAAEAAAQFAHFGQGPMHGLPDREPSLPFHQSIGETIFVVSKETTYEDVIAADRDTFQYIGMRLRTYNFVCVNASEVFNITCARMGLHPFEVLDAEYAVGD